LSERSAISSAGKSELHLDLKRAAIVTDMAPYILPNSTLGILGKGDVKQP